MICLKKVITFSLMLAIMVGCLSMVGFAAQPRASVGVYINNQAFNGYVQVKNGDTFVGIRKFANAMDPSAKVTYTSYNRTLKIKSSNLDFTAKDGQSYVIANGRYLYTPTPVYMSYGIMYAPVSIMAKSFGAKYSWQGSTSSYRITKGSGGIVPASRFYREDEVY